MDPGKAPIDRYQAGLALLSDLQADGSLAAGSVDASPKIFQLLRVVHAIENAAFSPIGKERVANFRAAALTLVADFLRSDEDLSRGCITLLRAGVGAAEELEKVNDDLAAANAKVEELQEALANEVASKEALMKENFVLRTRLHVQQQDLFQHDTQSRDVTHHLQALGKDRAQLASEKAVLAEECSVKSGILERQATAIAQLMDQCEKDAKERDKVVESLKAISEEKHVFEVNLRQHSKVIENLIHANADLIETANNFKANRGL
ncbi:uncharacterized protein LOC112348857 [Selaginella moellendorffii]|uniref:uncharacterized protein LOC112348857 n=1 Tax=Selaginella moellendorffii TaxID=88036 RepID=UPI000D1C77A1|nr:uncharacterized protein LOC112348857 [Selaginella moellendorffii]|eukprot:XP_024537916.1 uncharacterized protein LOC112348857 [Selaginella moellendorffii]